MEQCRVASTWETPPGTEQSISANQTEKMWRSENPLTSTDKASDIVMLKHGELEMEELGSRTIQSVTYALFNFYYK